MDVLIKIAQFIVSLSLLIIIHEFGHFLFAKLFKTRVEKFYLFFDPWFSLFKFKYRETEYGIGWLPLGGYVKISGMIDESMDTDQMNQPVQPYEFRAKPAWQRLLIMVGGVAMNVVLAIAIYIGLSYTYGDTYLSNENVKYGYVFNDQAKAMGFADGDKILFVGDKQVDNSALMAQEIILGGEGDVIVSRNGVQHTIHLTDTQIGELLDSKNFIAPLIPFIVDKTAEGLAAAQAGVMSGEQLIAIDNQQTTEITQLQAIIKQSAGKSLPFTFTRDSAGVTISRTLDIAVSEEGTIGVNLTDPTKIFTFTEVYYGFGESIIQGFNRAGREISSYARQIKLIFTPESGAYKSLGGFIAIGNIFPDTWDWQIFWRLTAFISIALAFMNILPIPALDGGHVLFLLVEVISGRKLPDKAMEWFQTVGMILLFALLLYVNGNDIYRFFIK